MSRKTPRKMPRTVLVSAFAVAAVAVASAAAFAEEDHERGLGPHGVMMPAPMMLAQGGPGMGSGHEAKDRDDRGRGDRESRRDRRFRHYAERRMQLLDTNGDGKISVAEIVAEEKRLFAAADVNGDGKLSPEEFRRRGRWFISLGTTSFFDMMDANGDQSLSVQELTAPSERWFKRYDTDKSGTIDANEYIEQRTRGRHGGR